MSMQMVVSMGPACMHGPAHCKRSARASCCRGTRHEAWQVTRAHAPTHVLGAPWQPGDDGADIGAELAVAALPLPCSGGAHCHARARGEAAFMLHEIFEQRCYLAGGRLALRDGGTVLDAGANIGAARRTSCGTWLLHADAWHVNALSNALQPNQVPSGAAAWRAAAWPAPAR
jgi:hypothetical protein